MCCCGAQSSSPRQPANTLQFVCLTRVPIHHFTNVSFPLPSIHFKNYTHSRLHLNFHSPFFLMQIEVYSFFFLCVSGTCFNLLPTLFISFREGKKKTLFTFNFPAMVVLLFESLSCFPHNRFPHFPISRVAYIVARYSPSLHATPFNTPSHLHHSPLHSHLGHSLLSSSLHSHVRLCFKASSSIWHFLLFLFSS